VKQRQREGAAILVGRYASPFFLITYNFFPIGQRSRSAPATTFHQSSFAGDAHIPFLRRGRIRGPYWGDERIFATFYCSFYFCKFD